jgi:hypothetical protein
MASLNRIFCPMVRNVLLFFARHEPLLLKAIVAYAGEQGAELVEGYPVEPKEDKAMPPAFAWTGIAKAYRRAGFKEAARRSPTRPIMRIELP